VCVAAVISFSALSMILAIPNAEQALTGADTDPVASTLKYYFGNAGFKGMLTFSWSDLSPAFWESGFGITRHLGIARNEALPCSAG